MTKAYKFDDSKPSIGSTVHAFRTLRGLRDFARLQGRLGRFKFWEIEGLVISDDGGEDGIQIRVFTVKQVNP